MKWGILSLLLASLASYSGSETAKQRKTKPVRNEPFPTFERIDRKLSTLAQQKEQLARAIVPGDGTKATETKPGGGRRWMREAEKVGQSARSIRMLAQRQEMRYRKIKQRFGVRAFGALERASGRVEEVASWIRRTKAESEAEKQLRLLEREILLLVRQYQSIAGGYGAARCSAKEIPCCLPKEGAESGDQAIAGKWICAKSVAACRQGFTSQSSQ
jgi:hypothetical protein